MASSRNPSPPEAGSLIEGRLCIGFGKREGRCLNDAGSSHSQLWCQECDDVRRAHITRQMKKISVGFSRGT